MSQSVIGALRVNLGLDSAQFERGAKKSQSTLKAMRNQFAAISGVAAAMGAALSAAALKGAADIDRAAKAGRRLETSVGGFRALEMAAGEAGVSLSTLADAVQTMDREVAKGSKAAGEALQALNLAAKDLEGLEADQKMAVLADSIEKAGLTTAQTSVVLQQLGIRNREMVLALGAGGAAFRNARADVEDYGLAVSDVDASRIESANDAIGRLGLISQYAGQQLAIALVPAMGRMAKAMTDSLREGGLLRGMIDGLVNNLDVLAFSVAAVTAVVGARLAAALALSTLALAKKAIQAGITASAMRALGVATAFAGGPIGAVAALLGAGAAAAVIFGRDTDTAGGIMSDTEKAAADLGTELGILSGNDLPIATAKTVDLANANLTLARSAYAAAEAEIAKAKAAADGAWTQMSTESAFLPGVEPAGAANYEAQIAKLVAANAELAKAEAELNARVMEGNQVKLDATEVVRDLNVNVRGLEDAAGGAGKGLKKTKEEAEDLAKELDGPLTSAVDSVASAFGDFFARGFRDFEDFKDSIVGGFRQMISQMISTAIANPIKIGLGLGGSAVGAAANAAGGIAGGAGGILGSLTSLAGSGGILGGVGGLASGLGGVLSGGGLGASFANLGGLLSGSVSGLGAIGAAIPAVAVIGVAIAAFKKKVTVLDTGLDVAIEGVEAAVSTFTTKNTKRFFGLSSKTRTSTGAAGAEIADPIQDAVTAIQVAVIDAAKAFDFGADAFEGFTYEFRLSLKGLSEDAQMEAINAELTKMGDAFTAMLPSFSSMAELVEAATQRLQIEDRLLALQGKGFELLTRQRERELAAVHSMNRPLLEQVYALEDLAQAAAQAAAVSSERFNIENRLLTLQGAETEVLARSRQKELQSIDATNRAMLEQVFALEDQQSAAEAATLVAENLKASVQRTMDLFRAPLSLDSERFDNRFDATIQAAEDRRAQVQKTAEDAQLTELKLMRLALEELRREQRDIRLYGSPV